MKLLLVIILFTIVSVVTNTKAGESPVSISIAIPAHNGGERNIQWQDRTTHFHVIISNTSDKQQKIWREWCSWGYFGLTFEITDKNGKKWDVSKKARAWTRNFPDWWILDPHESFVIDVYFGDSQIWQGFPEPKDGSQIVTMKAIFESKSDDEAVKNGVWTGRILSKPNKFTFSP